MDGDALEVADPGQVLAHLLALRGDRGDIVEVLQPAPPAARHVRAGGLHPVRPRPQDLEELRVGVAAPGAAHPRAHAVAGGGVMTEDDEAVAAAHPGAAEREVVDLELEDLVAAWPLRNAILHGAHDSGRNP
jgi:hypothetical protein